MASLYNSLYFSGGILFWASVLAIIMIVVNLLGRKERTILLFSFIIIALSGSWHMINKKRLNSKLSKMTCEQIVIGDKLQCTAYHSQESVIVSTYEKDIPIRFEKFYRDNEYQISRQVQFKIAEKCDFYAFCRYDYSRMSSEFSGRKDRIEKFLTEDLQKRIYFE